MGRIRTAIPNLCNSFYFPKGEFRSLLCNMQMHYNDKVSYTVKLPMQQGLAALVASCCATNEADWIMAAGRLTFNRERYNWS